MDMLICKNYISLVIISIIVTINIILGRDSPDKLLLTLSETGLALCCVDLAPHGGYLGQVEIVAEVLGVLPLVYHYLKHNEGDEQGLLVGDTMDKVHEVPQEEASMSVTITRLRQVSDTFPYSAFS